MKLKNMFKKTGGKNYISLTEESRKCRKGFCENVITVKLQSSRRMSEEDIISVQSVMRTFVWMHGEELRQS